MTIQGKNIYFRLVNETDASFILELREKRGQYLSQSKINLENQKEWIKEYKKRESAQEEFYFIVTSKNHESLGVVRLYDFKRQEGNSFCWGSWIIKDKAPVFTALESALLVYEFAFNSLSFEQSHFDVRKNNQKVMKFHERFGAIRTSENNIDIFYKITKEQFLKTKKKYNRLY